MKRSFDFDGYYEEMKNLGWEYDPNALMDMQEVYLGDPMYYFYTRPDRNDRSIKRVELCRKEGKKVVVIYNEQLMGRTRQELINYFEAMYILKFPNALAE
jgi:hypothetical protein